MIQKQPYDNTYCTAGCNCTTVHDITGSTYVCRRCGGLKIKSAGHKREPCANIGKIPLTQGTGHGTVIA